MKVGAGYALDFEIKYELRARHTMRRYSLTRNGKSFVDQIRDKRGEKESENTYTCDRSHFPFETQTLLSLFSYLLAKTFLARSACKGEISRWERMAWVWVP